MGKKLPVVAARGVWARKVQENRKGGWGGGRQEAAAPEPPGRGWGAATPQKDGDAPHREPARNAKAAGWAAVEPEN